MPPRQMRGAIRPQGMYGHPPGQAENQACVTVPRGTIAWCARRSWRQGATSRHRRQVGGGRRSSTVGGGWRSVLHFDDPGPRRRAGRPFRGTCNDVQLVRQSELLQHPIEQRGPVLAATAPAEGHATEAPRAMLRVSGHSEAARPLAVRRGFTRERQIRIRRLEVRAGCRWVVELHAHLLERGIAPIVRQLHRHRYRGCAEFDAHCVRRERDRFYGHAGAGVPVEGYGSRTGYCSLSLISTDGGPAGRRRDR
jgi:hypothetical protein